MNHLPMKLPAPPANPRLEIEALAAELADLKNRQRACAAEMDASLSEIRRQYTQIMAGLNDQIAARMALARSWAETHLAEFGPAKSLELSRAIIGYRTGQPHLKTLAGWTWARALKKLKAAPWNCGLVRVKEEINQRQILLERDQIGPERLRQIGLRLTQEERFFVEPKLTSDPTRESLAA